MITIIDYGLGNIQAFTNLYKRLNIPVAVAKNAGNLQGADKLILPGVGDFDHAMDLLEKSAMRQTLDEMVLGQKIPVLGVCVGMQMLASVSEEGHLPGLGWIDGKVRKFEVTTNSPSIRLPHMGWNEVVPTGSSPLFAGLEDKARFYFLHSFYFDCASPENNLAETYYGKKFSCAVQSENIFGAQFHPEKSHQSGIRLLKNFSEI